MRLNGYTGYTFGKYSIIEHLKLNRVTHNGDEVDDFFVIKLKDRHSKAALLAYADAAESTDPELAADVRQLAASAGIDHPCCQLPD